MGLLDSPCMHCPAWTGQPTSSPCNINLVCMHARTYDETPHFLVWIKLSNPAKTHYSNNECWTSVNISHWVSLYEGYLVKPMIGLVYIYMHPDNFKAVYVANFIINSAVLKPYRTYCGDDGGTEEYGRPIVPVFSSAGTVLHSELLKHVD